MDATLKHFLEGKKNLIMDTKRRGDLKQKTKTPKGHLEEPIESDPYKRFVTSVIKDKPSKKDLIEKMKVFIDAADAAL